MIVRAPAGQRNTASQPRPAVDLACAEIILGDAGRYGTESLMAIWAKIQKEKADGSK